METRTAEDYRLSWRAWLASCGQRIGFDTKILRHFSALCYARQPENALRVSKMGY